MLIKYFILLFIFTASNCFAPREGSLSNTEKDNQASEQNSSSGPSLSTEPKNTQNTTQPSHQHGEPQKEDDNLLEGLNNYNENEIPSQPDYNVFSNNTKASPQKEEPQKEDDNLLEGLNNYNENEIPSQPDYYVLLNELEKLQNEVIIIKGKIDPCQKKSINYASQIKLLKTELINNKKKLEEALGSLNDALNKVEELEKKLQIKKKNPIIQPSPNIPSKISKSTSSTPPTTPTLTPTKPNTSTPPTPKKPNTSTPPYAKKT
ncbi:hypothetical protein [Holospora undulata]|uniref:Uncharacterized protein n=1 Tax=Holospora undulata HU1 TaxID=1321371 RepID=A0A061JIB4_9PROT|nr:hypothetical protein [Holospora undulata]ETZ05377.1 hypothetical protein K737_300186 [Holospora undulata HU1]